MQFDRRSLLAGAASAVVTTPLAGCATNGAANRADGAERALTPEPARPLSATSVYVPGYMPNKARANGLPLSADRYFARNISDPDRPFRLLTRIGMDGQTRQALLPAAGHDVEISPDRSVGVLCGFEAADQVAFDPDTLDLTAVAPPVSQGWRGGGHAAYLADNKTVVMSERAPRQSLRLGNVKSHHGRITIRDVDTLKIRGSYSTYGIDPHDIRLIENDRYLVIANYGSLPSPGNRRLDVPRHVHEACVTIVDMDSGKLVDKRITDRRRSELRHLAAGGLDRIFAIQARLGSEADLARELGWKSEVLGADITSEPSIAYMAAATLKMAKGKAPKRMGGRQDIAEMRHGLSIRYDAKYDQALASYPSAHRLMVFDAASGSVLHSIDTRGMGLKYPCGITLLPDGVHYAVTGFWENLFVFERGSHRLNREACLYPVFFGHSHITAA
ncbi:DUF1513 domain-containing protein [Hoeflea sp. YIM 152468]|uniref:DUF1513 domain-containing protein n=1 Tax=Hoeflea sp. YIM 152468 TaxID=3031759 RepID=UPI0023DA525D|nr:DUF1513 domain-containing protein [Hoeflea sp. YIM 152468]MDF1606611.1 DUF1513 domain-containing protein [Hoeflea sp. YIM 152468]